MNKLPNAAESLPVAPSTPLALIGQEVAAMCGHLAALLRERFASDPAPVASAIQFLDDRCARVLGGVPSERWQDGVRERCKRVIGPLGRLATTLELADNEIRLLLLAGMADEHEGFSDIFRMLHPAREPHATAGLAAQLLCADDGARLALRGFLTDGELVRIGALRCVGSGPLFTRSVTVPSVIWTLLNGGDATVSDLPLTIAHTTTAGLDEWFATPTCAWATACLNGAEPCSVVVVADNDEVAFHRGLALCAQAGVQYLPLTLTDEATREGLAAIRLQATLLGAVPVVRLRMERAIPAACPELASLRTPVVLCCRSGRAPLITGRPAINIPVNRLSASAYRAMWTALVPELVADAATLAARYPVEPFQAARIERDLRFRSSRGPASFEQVAECFKNQTSGGVSGSIELVRPVSGWPQLVLPDSQLEQLTDAVQRLHQQGTVLDEWRFLAERRGARGVRLLFSGPPGTGKTLAAEVLAKALDVDLLVVDLSKVVSKWIGETEKNLAQVFNEAEQIKAVLFFDEADALFGKRTEVSDAHDRYANLETAYLLTRLERFDGLTIMATNFRRNIDVAFVRRLDYIVEFREPSLEERARLWRCHFPGSAPLAEDVDLAEIARLFPIVGGQIRNAALSAAYFAAHERTAISRDHIIRGIRREYDKAGKAFRELAVTNDLPTEGPNHGQ